MSAQREQVFLQELDANSC